MNNRVTTNRELWEGSMVHLREFEEHVKIELARVGMSEDLNMFEVRTRLLHELNGFLFALNAVNLFCSPAFVKNARNRMSVLLFADLYVRYKRSVSHEVN